jgi:DNA repair exonuclease SbcCD ATPase subunit
LRVIGLQVENFKRLVAIDLALDGSVVEITGKNGAGKSSTLDAIWAALGGEGAIPSKPIRKGEKAATIRVQLGDDKPTLVVTRSFAAKEDGGYTTKLTVEAADGARYAKPQTMLDDLVGALAFDPLAFTRMKPREQLEQLRAFVPGVNFEEIDGQNRADFDRRTDVNRQAKQARARLATMPVPGDPRHERIDETAIVAELEQAGVVATDIEKERARRDDLKRELRSTEQEAQTHRLVLADQRAEIEQLEMRIASIKQLMASRERSIEHTDAAAKRQLADLEALPPLAIAPDTADIRRRLAEARARNQELDERDRTLAERERVAKEAEAAEQRAAEYTARMEQRNRDKAAAIGAAKLPIDGLGFGDDVVLLNGLPFDQASSAEQLRVSVAIAAALSPKLRCAYVRDGSLLDDDGMRLLRELAEQYQFQVLCERVSGDSPVGIVIEAGRVKASADEVAA